MGYAERERQEKLRPAPQKNTRMLESDREMALGKPTMGLLGRRRYAGRGPALAISLPSSTAFAGTVE